MTNVFISYERSAEALVRKVRDALTAAGHVVWTDAELPAHRSYADVIEERLRSAEAVLVLWSAASARSQWVRAEAETAREAGKLVQASLDDSLPPMPFNQVQCASLAGWRGGQAAPGWKKVLASIDELGAGQADVPPAHDVKPAKRRRLVAILAVAVVALALLAAGAFVWLHGPGGPSEQAPAKSTGTSVAVLPFLNLSSDKDQEYFADGMTEEITSALVNVKGLKVVSRTSAFAFKGKADDVRVVGRALSATDVIEGSVRKQGDQLRITAQLVRTDTGEQLWTQSYDRQLKDVFAVQEDIARAIASALQVPLGLTAGENLVANRTTDTVAYDDYLRALAFFRGHHDIDQAIAMLGSIVKRDPTYAPAWSLLALNYIASPAYVKVADGGGVRGALLAALDRAERAAREAVRLDPRDASGYAALGTIGLYRAQWAAADNAYAKALALDPNNLDVLHGYTTLLAGEGRVQQALKVRQGLIPLEPDARVKSTEESVIRGKTGDYEGAVRILEQAPAGADRNINLATYYAAAGQYEPSAQALLGLPPTGGAFTAAANQAAAGIIRKAPAKAALADQTSPADEVAYAWVYVFVGAPDRALKDFEQFGIWVSADQIVWLPGPAFSAMRKTERFKQFVRKFGLVDYWRAAGWPDLCHPVGQDDFACD